MKKIVLILAGLLQVSSLVAFKYKIVNKTGTDVDVVINLVDMRPENTIHLTPDHHQETFTAEDWQSDACLQEVTVNGSPVLSDQNECRSKDITLELDDDGSIKATLSELL